MTRTQQRLQEGILTPASAGPSWEGIFTIPVCDISGVIPAKGFEKKKDILRTYGRGKIPTWCQPVCTNAEGVLDRALTLQFLDLVKMHNFDSPTIKCKKSWTGWRRR